MPEALLRPRTLSVPLEDGVLHIQVLDLLGQQARA